MTKQFAIFLSCLLICFLTSATKNAFAFFQQTIPIGIENAASVVEKATIYKASNSDSIIQDIVFSQDGNWFAAIDRELQKSYEGLLHIWDAHKWEEQEFAFQPIKAMSITFSSDSTLLAAGNSSGNITMLDMKTNQIKTNIEADISNINSIAFSPDNRLIAIASSSTSGPSIGKFAFRLMEIADKKDIINIASCDDICAGAGFDTMFNPSGNIVAAAYMLNGTLQLWDSNSGEKLAALSKAIFWVDDMTFTPDGKQLIYVAGDGIRIWNVDSAIQKEGKKDDFRVIATPAEGEFIQSMALNPDGTVLAVGYLDSTIKLWNLASGEQLTVLEGHKDRVVSLAFSPDGTLLASGGTDGTVRLWGVKE